MATQQNKKKHSECIPTWVFIRQYMVTINYCWMNLCVVGKDFVFW